MAGTWSASLEWLVGRLAPRPAGLFAPATVRPWLEAIFDYRACQTEARLRVAGTGADPRRGRALNPLRQARRFDSDGAYVRRFVPELAGVEGPAVHEPWRLRATPNGYPPPIVEPT